MFIFIFIFHFVLFKGGGIIFGCDCRKLRHDNVLTLTLTDTITTHQRMNCLHYIPYPIFHVDCDIAYTAYMGGRVEWSGVEEVGRAGRESDRYRSY